MNRISDSNRKLTSIAPPPSQPVGTGSPAKWAALEKVWNIKYPQQFKMLIDIYGDGRFADFIGFPSPFYTSSRELIPYEKFIKLRFEGLLWTRTQMPHHAFPPSIAEPAQLFPFGYTDNGETFFWLRKGHFNEWPIIYMDPGYTKDYELFYVPVWDFLENWLSRALIPKFSPPNFFPFPNPVFAPSTD